MYLNVCKQMTGVKLENRKLFNCMKKKMSSFKNVIKKMC